TGAAHRVCGAGRRLPGCAAARRRLAGAAPPMARAADACRPAAGTRPARHGPGVGLAGRPHRTEPDKMTPRPLRLAVVGHTNTGKTSLLRTLTRDPDFGEVSDSPGTTRHVEGVRLLADGAAGLELFDTPGMEDGMALLE